MLNLVRALLVLAAAVLQALVGFFPGWFGVETSVGEVVDPVRTPLVPIGWAFAIWGLLYAGHFVFAVVHGLMRDDPVMQKVGWLALFAFAGNAFWAWHQPSYGPGMMSFVFLEIILLFAIAASLASRLGVRGGMFRGLAYGSLFALAGWITVASPGGLSIALNYEGLASIGPEETGAVLPIILGWAVIAWALAYVMRSWFYAAPILWGLFGVAMANQQDTQFMIGVLAVASSFIGVTLFAKSRAATA